MEVPQNEWSIVENPMKMDALGVPLLMETPTCILVLIHWGPVCLSTLLVKLALNPHDLEMPWFVLQDVLLDLHSTNKPSTPFARLPGNNSISFIDDVQISRYFWSLAV